MPPALYRRIQRLSVEAHRIMEDAGCTLARMTSEPAPEYLRRALQVARLLEGIRCDCDREHRGPHQPSCLLWRYALLRAEAQELELLPPPTQELTP